jgi:hypothetical protein
LHAEHANRHGFIAFAVSDAPFVGGKDKLTGECLSNYARPGIHAGIYGRYPLA